MSIAPETDKSEQAAAIRLAGRVRHHSSHCTVAYGGTIDRCDCWILEQARADVAVVAPLLIAEGRRLAAAEIRAGVRPGAIMPAELGGDTSDARWVGEWAARLAEGSDRA